MPAGRPSAYREEYAEQAYKLCLLGSTDEQLADFFGVCVATINNWKADYPKFLESLKAGKEIADAEVAEALYHRAKGYSHPEEKIFNTLDDDGNPLIVSTIKHYPPDTAAAFIWLKNRQGGRWKDKSETEHTINGLEAFLSDLADTRRPPSERDKDS